MADFSARSSVSSLRSLSVHLNPRSLVDLTTLVAAFLDIVSVALAGLQELTVLTVTS